MHVRRVIYTVVCTPLTASPGTEAFSLCCRSCRAELSLLLLDCAPCNNDSGAAEDPQEACSTLH